MGNRYTALIVSSDQHNIERLSDILKDSYNIITAGNGIDALEIMRGDSRPDIAVVDESEYEDDVARGLNEDSTLFSVPVVFVVSDDDIVNRVSNSETVDFAPVGNPAAVRRRVENVLRLSEINGIKCENECLKSGLSPESCFSSFMDNMPGGVAVIKTNGSTAECVYSNNELPVLFGMSMDKFRMQFVIPKSFAWINTFIEKARETDKFTFVFSVGEKNMPELCRYIRVVAGRISENDDEKEYYCVFIDITAEKRQELCEEESGRQLRESKSRLEMVVNNAPGGISFSELGSDGRFHTMFMNRGLVEMLGYSSLDEGMLEVSENAGVGICPNDVEAIREKIFALPESGGHFKHVAGCQTRGGKIWISMRCQVMRGEDGTAKMYSFITNITKEKRFEDELRAVAYFDPLTGLYNRHAFMRNARRVIDENPLTEFSMMRLNIRSFKVVNDLLGRDVGDKVLMKIADVFRELFSGESVFARFFADNFAVLTPYSERGIHPRTVLNAVQEAVSSSGLLPHEIQYYIGVYRITDRSMSVENMADRASIACRSINGSYQAHIAYYDEKMRLNMLDEQEVCDDSRRALENGEFCVYYQPVYGIKAKRFVSAEALVRWNHPVKGMIGPGKFIPVFEKNGFIAELDLYILEQVCKYMKRRRDAGLSQIPISVNISRMSLYDANLFEKINGITSRYGIDTKYFRIEITESAYNDNPEQLLETVGKLRENGYPVLMDDFGSGYSSLNTLKDIPIDILKLDMKFMQGFEENSKVGTIVTSVARMAKWLNVPMLAEGVETKEQFDFLESIGCAYIQGYYFSRPVPEEEFTRLIELKEESGDNSAIEGYALNEEVNELLGSSALVSKLISGAFGGFGIYEMYDGKLEVIRVNEGYERIIGYTPEDISEKPVNVWEMMPPEDAEISRNACIEALNTDKAVRAVIHRYDRNGKIVTLDGVHRKLGGAKENPIICIAFNDITELLENEQLVDRSRTEINEILKATDAVAVDIDFENETVFCVGDLSDYGIDLIKTRENYEIDNPLECAVHPDDIEKVKILNNERSAGKRIEEFRLYNKKDGKYYWWKFTEVRMFSDEGKMVRLIGIANNIDSEKRAKLELEEERAHGDAVMSRLGAGILMVEISDIHKAHIIYSNKSFWNIIGQNEANDENFFDNIFTGMSDKDCQEISESIKNGNAVNSRYHITRSNGENAVLDYTIGLSREDNGCRVYMVLVSDVTEAYNTRAHLEAIVRNFRDGLALVDKNENGIEITYANDRFFSILHTEQENSARVIPLLETVLDSGVKTGDIRINHAKTQRIVRTSIDEIGRTGMNTVSYIVEVSDVTVARSESRNRIAERMANAGAGLYDEVIEINYRDPTVKPTSSRREPERAKKAKAHSIESIIDIWGRKYVHPDDYGKFRDMVTAPADNPDFTDSYCEIRVMDRDGEYCTLGLVLVRSRTDVCMMFVRDRARFDNSLTSAQVAETYRLYNLVAEQSHTTVIEIDHIAKKISCSPTIGDFWISTLSEDEISGIEYVRQGLAVYPEDKKKYSAFINNVLATDEPQTVTLRMKMADGSFKWCRITVSVLRGKNNILLKSLCTINLVHNEVVASIKAHETDEFMRRTVAHIPVGVGVYRIDGGKLVSLYVSDNMHDMVGKDSDYYYSDIETFIEENYVAADENKEYSRMTCIKREDGSEYWLRTIFRVLEENGDHIVYIANIDVTDRVESQRSEEARDQMYSLLLDESGMIVFAYDPKSDLLTYIRYCGENNVVRIENVTENKDGFTQIYPDDREKMAEKLKYMSSSAGLEDTIIVRVNTDGELRRYKALLKSVADESGVVFKVVGKLDDAEEEITHMEQMQGRAKYDLLCSDIFNKSTTEELVRAELERNPSGAVMMLDVDDFKSINDSLGHMFGDEFLKNFASIVKSAFGESDIVGRYGGDEFFVFMPHATAAQAEKKASRILEKVSSLSVPIEGGIKCSIGIAGATPDNHDYGKLFRQADSALYQAKNRGKNCYAVFDASMGDGSFRIKEHVGKDRIRAAANTDNTLNIMARVFDLLYSGENITDGINDILSFVGKTFNVSRAYIFENTDHGECCRNTFEWCNEGISHEINLSQTFSYKDDFGGNYLQNTEDGVFYCHDINELNEKRRELCERRKTKSMLECAVINNGKYKGFVGFEECGNNRFWTKSQIDVLKFIAKLFSITFTK